MNVASGSVNEWPTMLYGFREFPCFKHFQSRVANVFKRYYNLKISSKYLDNILVCGVCDIIWLLIYNTRLKKRNLQLGFE